MSGYSPSALSVIGAIYYLIVGGACLSAIAKKHQAGVHSKATWAAIALFFSVLALARFIAAEDMLRDALRALLIAEGHYATRRSIQLIAALFLAVSSIAIGWQAWPIFRRKIGSRQEFCLLAAAAAAAGLAVLFVMRIISLHAIDWFLFGPLRLNWFLDIGMATIVLIAALIYRKAARIVPPRS